MQETCDICPEVIIPYDKSAFDVAIAWNYDPTTQTVEIYHTSEAGVSPTATIILDAICSSDPTVELLSTEVVKSNTALPAVISNIVRPGVTGSSDRVCQKVYLGVVERKAMV